LIISPLLLDVEGWIRPDFWVLLEQSFGCVLGSRNELIQKDLVVGVVVEIYLGGIQVLELGHSVVVFGNFLELELLLKDLSGVDFQHFLWVILFY
jgi:hypothetical protein